VFEIRIPGVLPPFRIDDKDVESCPGHPTVVGDFKMNGNITHNGRLQGILDEWTEAKDRRPEPRKDLHILLETIFIRLIIEKYTL
jgi:hypothetical protein